MSFKNFLMKKSTGINKSDEKKIGWGTGDTDFEEYRTIEYFFDKYIIKVVITSDNKFVGIKELGINKDFLSYRQRMALKSYRDVDEFYSEE